MPDFKKEKPFPGRAESDEPEKKGFRATLARVAEMEGSDEELMKALADAGWSVREQKEPVKGDDKQPAGKRPERNPPSHSGGEDDKSKGEPMSVSEIASDLFKKRVKKED